MGAIPSGAKAPRVGTPGRGAEAPLFHGCGNNVVAPMPLFHGCANNVLAATRKSCHADSKAAGPFSMGAIPAGAKAPRVGGTL